MGGAWGVAWSGRAGRGGVVFGRWWRWRAWRRGSASRGVGRRSKGPAPGGPPAVMPLVARGGSDPERSGSNKVGRCDGGAVRTVYPDCFAVQVAEPSGWRTWCQWSCLCRFQRADNSVRLSMSVGPPSVHPVTWSTSHNSAGVVEHGAVSWRSRPITASRSHPGGCLVLRPTPTTSPSSSRTTRVSTPWRSTQRRATSEVTRIRSTSTAPRRAWSSPDQAACRRGR